MITGTYNKLGDYSHRYCSGNEIYINKYRSCARSRTVVRFKNKEIYICDCDSGFTSKSIDIDAN